MLAKVISIITNRYFLIVLDAFCICTGCYLIYTTYIYYEFTTPLYLFLIGAIVTGIIILNVIFAEIRRK
jgi:uncharacterized integral membrane protein